MRPYTASGSIGPSRRLSAPGQSRRSRTIHSAPPAIAFQCASGADAEPGSTREDVRRLHSAGYLADARFRARDLAPGEDRAAYLAEDR